MKEQTISNLKKLKSFHNGSFGADIGRAIQALEQQPCEDAVSRQALIDKATSWNAHFTDSEKAVSLTDIMSLPSVTPQQTRWIPVSERLPELGKRVLCQCQANIYEVLKLTVDGWYYNPNHCYMESFVIAWMPLPQPYAESEDKE